ncbi:hypothetical protein [Alkaliphilus sp. B6464]|uniref:hypothetical protein n=1 Tax=Alkaliphilus sp. B6464 TaxID=2731219 RepID=UPI001BA4A34A|nr:hypothetical protein [Alkaliphilus sp. B6464]QUH21813.1 hypothetical protein HYG84_17915 [Alkaliphilus sp. B6464]
MEQNKIAINHLETGNQSKQHIELAIKALEKQIPKDVVRERAAIKTCPVCDSVVNKNYCQNCGQKLNY